MRSLNMLRNEKGLALLTVIILSFFLFALSLTYFEKTGSEKRLALASQNGLNANLVADAAVEEIFWRYNYNSFKTAAAANGWTVSGTDATYGSSGSPISFTDNSGNAVGTYYASISNYATAPVITVDATYTGGSSSTLGNSSQVMAELRPKPLYGGAIVAKGAITITSSGKIDSYNSANGVYDSATNSASNGDVMTNSTAQPAITVGGSADLYGDAAAGSGATIVTESSGVIHGGTSTGTSNTINSNTVPAPLAALTSAGTLNSDYTFTSGSYRYDKWDLGGGDDIVISGDVTVYLSNTTGNAFSSTGSATVTVNAGSTLTIYTDGAVSMLGDGIVNDDGIINNTIVAGAGSVAVQAVKIIGTSTCTSVNISGNGDYNGLINAPDAAFTLGGSGNLCGAVIANTATVNGSGDLHYDENLQNNGPTSGYDLKWYRKIK